MTNANSVTDAPRPSPRLDRPERPSAPAARRYLALWLPFLPTDRFRIERAPHPQARGASRSGTGGATPPEGAFGESASAEGAPLALVAKVRGGLRLLALDQAALDGGLVPGMTLADARAIEPELHVAEMDSGADRRWLERLAARCQDWSPLVTLAPPDAIVLDIAGVAHLFGGEAALVAQIEEVIGALGVTLRLACGSTAEAAQVLARHDPGHAAPEEERA
ncbi:hypothetical protein MTR62_21085, partial [Novosphingobium sp. 1949]|nr:hypothetical protein [Novosphingobium organovorum]